MAEWRPNLAGRIVTVVALCHLVGVVITSVCLSWWGNWEDYRSGLTLTLRILWGVWFVHALGAILTNMTMFAWIFRRYFRPDGSSSPPPPPLRLTRAPWYKSGKVSFSISLVLVSLTGLCALATAVMYILIDQTGDWVFWLVFKIIWASWWVLVVAIVVIRVSLFQTEKTKAKTNPPANGAASTNNQPQPTLAARDSSEGSS
jgi:hypothetical protein